MICDLVFLIQTNEHIILHTTREIIQTLSTSLYKYENFVSIGSYLLFKNTNIGIFIELRNIYMYKINWRVVNF